MTREMKLSRRDVATGAGAVLSSAAIAMLAASPAEAGARQGGANEGDIRLLNTALGLEHEAISAYTLAAGSGLLTPAVTQIGVTFRGHHQQHRDELIRVIRALGGTPVEARPDAEVATALNAGSLRNQNDVLELAARLERGAATAYLGIMPSLTSAENDHLAARIAADESAHFVALAQALGRSFPQQAFFYG
jgi:rubrerythrin